MDSHTLSSRLEAVFRDSIRTKEEFLRTSLPLMEKATRLIVETFERGGKLLIFGNGGSSSDAAHIAGELVSRFYKKPHRPSCHCPGDGDAHPHQHRE